MQGNKPKSNVLKEVWGYNSIYNFIHWFRFKMPKGTFVVLNETKARELASKLNKGIIFKGIIEKKYLKYRGKDAAYELKKPAKVLEVKLVF